MIIPLLYCGDSNGAAIGSPLQSPTNTNIDINRHKISSDSTFMIIKRYRLVVALAAASLLTAQQIMIWNSSALGIFAGPAREFSSLPTIIGTVDQHQQPSYQDREQRFARLLSKPTEIYVLGERNSGTNYVSKS